ncbi:hypothetical protein PM082_004361 [Marasmius tenuissimus]|nr:hypothetical protein PM082_004361 [Marasmius tenuissimus]
MRTAATPLYPVLTTSIWHQKFVAYADVVSSTILVYDVVLNLALEVKHVWGKNWTFVTVVYLIQRYLPFVDTVGMTLYHEFQEDLTPRYCFFSYTISGWSYIIGIVLSEVLLAVRLWAVWERRISAAIIIFVFCLGCLVPCFVSFNSFKYTTEFSVPPLPQLRGCFISGGNDVLYLCWIFLMVYDTGTMIMMVIPGISAFRMGGKSELVKTIYRDGIIYYILIFLVSVVNVVVVCTLPRDLVNLLAAFERVLHSVLTSHAILHIRRVASLKPTVSTICTMEFAATANDSQLERTSPGTLA